jgi:hypothetical protein
LTYTASVISKVQEPWCNDKVSALRMATTTHWW